MRRHWAGLVLAASCELLGCTPSGPGPEDLTDVVLVVIDTLRADHTGVYGYGLDTTPNLDRLAKRGVAFEVAYAPAGTTAVSHASLFTSKYPLAHGVLRNGLSLAESERTLAEMLAENGYATAAFVSSFPVSRRFGFDQGFEHFDDRFDTESSFGSHPMWEGVRVVGGFDRPPRQTTDAAIAWLKERTGDSRPLFLWAHFFDPHTPNRPPAEYARRFPTRRGRVRKNAIARYDAEIAYVDAEVGRLLDFLESRPDARSILVIVTSDHGEGLWDHGDRYHNRHTYEEEVRIPLLMAWTGHLPEAARIGQPARLMDLAPTIASALGISRPPQADPDAIDLLPHARGVTPSDPERAIFVQRPYYPGGHPQYPDKGHGFGLRVGDWKYFEAPDDRASALYDLSRDPKERRNVAAKFPEKVDELSGRIAAWRAEQQRRAPDRPLVTPDDAIEGLRALGYIDGPSPDSAAEPAPDLD